MKSNYRANCPKDWKNIIEKEVNQQMSQVILNEERDLMALVLWVLHDEYGFGKVRLERFAKVFDEKLKELSDWYAMDSTDQVFLCRRKLKEYGIDVDELVKGDDLVV